mmetsp:Transcript_14113/g.13645  ORF Transcript_14113/g.13645 Transcript_14113/m.13645 type:complete len:459 (+) Transcript_14113:474-1850(+)
MTLVFENDLVAPTLTLTIAYLLLSIYACKRLIALHRSAPDMNTRKLFVMTCLLTTILRLMTFGSMTVFNYCEFHLKVPTNIEPTHDDGPTTDAFFEKATLVLLDVPDWCCISAYVLLIVVCAEALLQSRRHWLNSYEFKRLWILGYLVFNTLLYTVQVCLYSLLFVPSVDQEILTAFIYLSLTFFNLGLPFLWVLGYIFLSIRFSGFPFSSLDAKKRCNSLVRLGSIWTIARLGWGFIALTSVMQSWLISAQKNVHYYSLVLISVFFFAEILPIAISLQNDCLESLTERPISTILGDVTPNWEEKILGGNQNEGGRLKQEQAKYLKAKYMNDLDKKNVVNSNILESKFSDHEYYQLGGPINSVLPYSISRTDRGYFGRPRLDLPHKEMNGKSRFAESDNEYDTENEEDERRREVKREGRAPSAVSMDSDMSSAPGQSPGTSTKWGYNPDRDWGSWLGL